MSFKRQCVVVKFDDSEKFAVAVKGGNEQECGEFKAYLRGLFHDRKDVHFGVYSESDYNFWENKAKERALPVYEYLYICLSGPNY